MERSGEREARLDHWTKAVVRAALDELRASTDPTPETPALVGELSQRVRQALSLEGIADPATRSRIGLADELALAVYLTVAAQPSGREITPSVLASLNAGLERTLRSLGQPRGEPSAKEIHS